MNRGLVCFAKDNSLETGDVCYFELLSDDDISFKVTIVNCASRGEEETSLTLAS
ncbi:hypothetical protein LINGRAHAP2_LOCUS27592 [Linum grandiflorum]